MTGQLHNKSMRDRVVPVNIQQIHSSASQRKVSNPLIKRGLSLSLDLGSFHRPREDPPSPDPQKHLKANGYGRIFINDNHNGSKLTGSVHVKNFNKSQTGSSLDDHQRDHPSSPINTQWPPGGLKSQLKLGPEKAKDLISKGALSFEGFVYKVSHNLQENFHKCATVGVGAAHKEFEALASHETTSADMSLASIDHAGNAKPWDTLEQPSMAQCFGLLPGTVSLSRYINSMSRSLEATGFPEYSVQPRQTGNLLVLQRLHYLQGGLDADPEFTEEFLYTQLIHDPNWQKGDAVDLEGQMAALVVALNNPIWVDFRGQESQVLAQYFDAENPEVEELYYQQLLLSVELSLRIKAVTNWAPEGSIMANIPEKVAWDLAVAKVWQKKMTFQALDDTFQRAPTMFHTTALTKNIQKERLLKFARNMKWAGIADVERALEGRTDGEFDLESKSPITASWMTGIILPGPSASLLVMRSLIDCDAKVAKSLRGFDKMHSDFGFQYRGNTFWHWESIVAKVLGACKGVKQDYGWVGPCLASDDLDQSEVLLARSEPLRHRMSTSHVMSMSARSAALGPPSEYYSGDEYVLPLPCLITVIDNVRIHKLAFRSCSVPASDEEPETLHAAVIFAIGNEIIPIRLCYNVSFIYSPACHGTHPLFWDYAYETVKADELVVGKRSRNGNIASSNSPSNESSPTTSGSETSCRASISIGPRGPEAILVVEAYGTPDHEVLARAWAAHLGYSAVVANIQDTCMACAIRMAYAAATPMVILNKGHQDY